ncbi:DUF1254 domain-containing protein [Streptomyces sp. NL15-2K]|uniref:DUF1254 domain-containing protein n=1 Tax=Streptomyces sp. NL15-2K TaxID=376149 RepID=UPI0026EA588F|nr:DUF1254 domain-containing protein [Kutzneria buriramensis]WKX11119.1 DUF1254 domain-containing protein [Kutzneria buriramensis]
MSRRSTFKAATALAALGASAATANAAEGKAGGEAIGAGVDSLGFDLGMPTPDRADKLYDALDFQQAVLCYLWAIPTVGMESARQMLVDNAGARSGDLVLVTGYREVSVMLGSNVTTPYVFAHIDLADRPVVFEYPEGATAGSLVDWWDRPLIDVGASAPDAGKGAVFILVGPGQEAPKDLPRGARVLRSRTRKVLLFSRGLDSDPRKVEEIFETARIYPYGQSPGQGRTRVLRFKPEGRLTSMKHPEGFAYWRRLVNALEQEPVEDRDRFFAAMLKQLGIESGRTFEPDARQRKILQKAAVVGEETAKAIAFNTRIPGMRYRADAQWEYLIPPSFSNEQDVPGGTLFEERTKFFYEVTGTSEAVLTRTPGAGSAYLVAYHDTNGAAFDGGRSYRLRVPADVPAKLFWSITLYDTDTRGLIQNRQQIVDKSSHQKLRKNPDGTIDIVMSPTAPAGLEKNWIPTTPGRSWYAYFRLFGPLEPYFDRSWGLPDIQATTS